ncbi:HipA N-terminal domain-containing protein [Aurantibacillus circumpalustris]|uniref:HipA N-terminal domain-containing protein n=1 Tax=Aurantibacillus circumpalustris TaxID=3036359 RepID=UPI00295A850F|nr:HipA N-terminal domain-containing protein [Aurantibacillus circumpalustris]
MLVNMIAKFFRNEEQSEDLSTPINAEAQFVLTYKDLVVGTLTRGHGKWAFEYSEAFKRQNKISVLTDFPHKDKKYEESYLWPFFAHRIPGLGQPQVKEIIKEEHIDSKNEIDLLRRFGQKTITNPFELASS